MGVPRNQYFTCWHLPKGKIPQESINLRGIPLAWYIFFCQKIYTTQGKEKIMKFLKIVEEIQNKPENIDYLVLIRCGIFFYGVGKDAVLLREQFGLNNICISKNICKCAIPVAKIDKFIRKIIAKNISVAIYEYYPKKENRERRYELLKRIILSPVAESRKCFNCAKCSWNVKQNHNLIDEKIAKIKNL